MQGNEAELEAKRSAVEAKVFKKLDKRREDIFTQQQQRQVARDEQAAPTQAVIAELDEWIFKMNKEMALEVPVNEEDIVMKTIFLDKLAEDVKKLDAFFADKSNYLTAYDVRRFQNALQDIRTKFQEIQDQLQPKKKFGFKGKKLKQSSQIESQRKTEPELNRLAKNFASEGFELRDVQDKTIVIKKSDFSGGDILLSRLRNCTIYICGTPSTLHATDLNKCTLLSGPVKTSVFIERCQNCKFDVTCQQLRTHETSDSDFYLHVTSKGIIEDCSRVRFAPSLHFDYEDASQDLGQSGLDLNVNNWDKIDDFNWLASGQASPNWSVLPENERQSSWDKIPPLAT